MILKFKFRWAYVIYILALILVVLLTDCVTKHILAKSYVKNDNHFEAWELVHKNPLMFSLSKTAKDDGVLFFDVMARHKSDDKNQIPDSWTLPDFTGWSCAEIACALKNIGQAYEVKFTNAPEMYHNVIVKHEPAQGSTVSKSDVITLYANSAYGKPTKVSAVTIYGNPANESGEWLVFARGEHLYRTHSDFSDIEIIYTYNNTILWFPFPILFNENTVYLNDYIMDDNRDHTYLIVKLSVDSKENEVLFETTTKLAQLTYYYDNKLHFMERRDISGTFDLQTLEYSSESFVPSNIIFNDVLYGYETEEDENNNSNSTLWMKNEQGETQTLCNIDGRIEYIVCERNNIFIGAQVSGSPDMVYRYDLNKNKLILLQKESYSLYGGNLNISCNVFNKQVYLVGMFSYDYRYDIHKDRKYPITIATGHSVDGDLMTNMYICGNYMLGDMSTIKSSYVYNMLTQEWEDIEQLDALDK